MKDIKSKIVKILRDRGITDVPSALDALEKLAPLAELVKVVTENTKPEPAKSKQTEPETAGPRLNRDLSVILNAYQSNEDWLDKLTECRSDTERYIILEGLKKNNEAIGLAVIRHVPG